MQAGSLHHNQKFPAFAARTCYIKVAATPPIGKNVKAIISDIHGNLDALQAVLDAIDQIGVREIICLGDVVGYGPQPRECLDIIKNVAKFTILGNHEEAVLD